MSDPQALIPEARKLFTCQTDSCEKAADLVAFLQQTPLANHHLVKALHRSLLATAQAEDIFKTKVREGNPWLVLTTKPSDPS